jgi:hypothetical protein
MAQMVHPFGMRDFVYVLHVCKLFRAYHQAAMIVVTMIVVVIAVVATVINIKPTMIVSIVVDRPVPQQVVYGVVVVV